MLLHNRWRATGMACVRIAATVLCLMALQSPGVAQTLTNASFETPAVTANTDSLRPTTATWSFSGQAGIRNNSAPNGSDGKQAAFLSVAPVSGNNNVGSVRQSVTLKPGTYYVRYLAAVKTPGGRPQPLQFYVNGVAQGGALNPRYLTDTTTGGFEAGWTQPFVVSTAGSYELRFDATNLTNYGTVAAPLYAVAYLDAITLVSVPTGFANASFETTGNWTLSSGATTPAATDAPEGAKVLTLAAAATASQSLSLPAGRYSLSLKLGKASAAAGTLNVEVASNGAAAVTVATVSATTAAEYRSYTTPGFALPAGTHVITLRASGSAFSLDNVALNDAGPDAVNSGFETPVLSAPSSATAAGPTVANPTNATWSFTGSGGLIQANAGSSNTSAPRTVAGKQYLALSSTGAIAQSLAFAAGTYVAVGQVAQGGFKVLIDGIQVGKLSASTLDFREVMSAPFVVSAGSHSLGLAVDSTYSPATPKLDEIRLLRVDVPPNVSITAPANGAIYQTGATVNITASATDPDGISSLTISRTPAGGSATQLATSATSPLSTSWTNSSANSYTITAAATDSTGATSSTAINIRVNANPSATVAVSPTGPVVTSASAVAATVTVSAASDTDGTVTRIEFLQDAVVAATCTKTIPPAVAPFTCALSLPPRAAAYALTVRVTDNDGGTTTTAPLTLRINTAPTVTLAAACVAPCASPATVNLTATPADSDGSISKVDFYDGATLLGSKSASPWTYSHTTAATGSHSYTARAFDSDSASTTSSAQAVTVSAPVPTVTLTASCTAPCNGPAAVTLTAVPVNITGTVSKVEFNDGTTLLNTDTTTPYAFAATAVAAATHSYTAKVYVTGTTAAVATSTAQSLRVNALPTVTLSASCVAPCANPATVNLTATPADTDGSISKVEFYDGATILGSKSASPWTHSHTTAATGSHSYTAKAFDNDNANTTSGVASISVASPQPSLTLTATCTAPCAAPAVISFTVTGANLTGSNYNVIILDGGTSLGYATATGANQFSLIANSFYGGTHSFTAQLLNWDLSYVMTSNTASINVAGTTLKLDWLPRLYVADGIGLGTVTFKVAVTVNSGSVAGVKLYADGSYIGDATGAGTAWSYAWRPSAGLVEAQVTAVAMDDQGRTRASAVTPVRGADFTSLQVTSTIAPVGLFEAMPIYADANGLGRVQISFETQPTVEQWQGAPSSWYWGSAMWAWKVDLLENGVVVDTQMFGYEIFKVLPADLSPYQHFWTLTSGTGEFLYVTFKAGKNFVRNGVAPGSYTYAVQLAPTSASPRKDGNGVTYFASASLDTWRGAETSTNVLSRGPTISITQPSSNATAYQGNVWVELSADGPTQLGPAFVYDGAIQIGQCIIGAPSLTPGHWEAGRCSVAWNTATLGSHTLSARVSDAESLLAISAPVTFTVAANVRPTVSIVSPAYGTRYRAPAAITVLLAASDADGNIASVNVSDGTTFARDATPVAGGYSVSFTGESAGPATYRGYNLVARSTDDRGAVSNPDTTTVVAVGAPSVTLKSACAPCSAGLVKLNVTSNYLNEDISAVRYLRDGELFASVTNAALQVTDSAATAGNHNYVAEITTLFNEVVASAPVSLLVNPTVLPTVAILEPAVGASFANPDATVELRASANAGDFLVSGVRFYVDGTVLIGQAQPSMGSDGIWYYVYAWTSPGRLSAGVHQLTAQAIDTRGNVGVSAPVSVTVTATAPAGPQAAPITSPVTGSEFPAASTITVTAGGSSADANITAIELWRVGTGAGGGDEWLGTSSGNTLNQALMLPATSVLVRLYTVAINAAGGRTPSVTTVITTNAANTDPRYYVWTNMNAALKAGNKAAALTYLTPTAQGNYSVMLDLILPQAAAIVASYSPIVQISDSFDLADYLVARTVSGTRLVFALRFILMDDGKWKLDGL